ncbi:DMT family transporter [Mucilaginibacter sp. UR6-1]|uniref:DMT family transporter n=1 Tax=Mucilaginibacter sp. UR6-1 TaxID=1435643 RepID=UPI001E2CA90F|nr:DMT family transporter [Mucilaginibacter sp. UR6-1]MCC8410942.1 DMT family transporter [Mucilaginibacter sp. UR6-1]
MFKNILPGLLFSVLWSTGAIAVKFGIPSADALLLASIRFIGTGIVFAPIFLLSKKYRFLPKGSEWKSIIIYGLLNTTLCLGSFFAAQKYASAGISTLFIAVTPLLIALFSTLILKRKLNRYEVIGMLVALVGLSVSSSGAFIKATIQPLGVVLLIIYIAAYALSSVYFSAVKISLSNAVFNVWQVFIGGLLLLPFCPLFNADNIRHIDARLFITLLWMIVVLSFVANQLWLYLVKRDTVSAATWLYLTPVFGYVLGYIILGEGITVYEIAGAILVIIGLAVSKKQLNKAV